MTSLKSEPNSAETAAKFLLEKKIVILPTDTIYGFSALSFLDGKKTGLDKRIDEIKKSAESKPLIELIARPQDVFKYTDQEIPEKIFKKWPCALTLLVKNNDWYAGLTGRAATAFRCPGDEWLRRVVELSGSPVYSTSVNYSGSPALASGEEIVKEFGQAADLIVLDEERGGQAKNPAASTLVSIEDGGQIRVLRQGSVTIE